MSKLISSALLFILFWSLFMRALSVTDEEILATVPAPGPQALVSLPQPDITASRADHLVAPAQLPLPVSLGTWLVVASDATDDASDRRNPQMTTSAQDVEVPETFPLSEQHWRDALPEEADMEPVAADDPMWARPEPLDNPWGGEWGDQGGGG